MVSTPPTPPPPPEPPIPSGPPAIPSEVSPFEGLPPYTMAGTPPLTPIVLPAGSPTRSFVLLVSVAVAALVALILNLGGLFGFPSNAPVEAIFAFGITVDLAAIVIACGIGAVMARRRYPLRASTPISVVALAFAVAATLIWALTSGIASIILLLGPEDGRYMHAAGGLFISGTLWVLAVVFGAHSYRRGGTRRNNVFAIVALALVGAVVAYAVFSSVIYGMGLTE